MADCDWEGNSSPEPAVFGVVGGGGENFGEGAGREVGDWGDVSLEAMRTEGLAGGCANEANSNGVAEGLPGVAPSMDGLEELGVSLVEAKRSGDQKVEEGEVLKDALTEEVSRVDGVVGAKVTVDEEKSEADMVLSRSEFVDEGKGPAGGGLVVADSNAIVGCVSNVDVVSGNLEKSIAKYVTSLAGDRDHSMNYASAIHTMTAIDTFCLDENVGCLGERTLGNSEKLCSAEEKVGSQMGATQEELVKDGEILDSGEMGVTMTNVESLESGVTIIDGGAAICGGIVFDNTNAEQVIYENYRDYRVNELVSEEAEFNSGESLIETGAKIQLTGSVDTEIIGRGNEMYFCPSGGSMKTLEGRLLLSDKKTTINVAHAYPSTMHMEVDDASVPSDAGLHIGNAMDVDEQDNGAEDLEMAIEEEESGGELQTDGYREVDQAVYHLSPDEENVFAVSDLVWGKVRSHPWWPGQIFDPSGASEKAMEYHEKDSFLVVYFGDNTFAWSEASLLKPFRSYFPSAVRQSNAEEFQNAVDCALEEVSRRVELGLSCSCLSKDVVDEIKVKVIENVGVRPDSCTVKGMGKFADANSFKPYEFVRYLKALAQSPSSGADKLELVIAKAQLLTLYRHKGFNQLPEFQSFGDLIDDTAEALDNEYSIQASDIKDGMATSAQVSADVPRSSSHRRKHNLKDIVYHRRKEISVFELMDEAMMYSEDDEFELDGTLLSKRLRVFDAGVDSGSIAKGVNTIPSLPKPSFKIGACISRVASQMTRSPSLKFQSEGVEPVEGTADIGDAERGKSSVAPECQSLPDLVSQLQSVAINPKGGHSSFSVTASFFSDFRNSVAVGLDLSVGSAAGKRRKSSQYAGGFSEAFEFEDMKDSYWTDRTVGNGFEDNPDGLVNGENCASFEHEKPRKAGRRPYTRRRDVEVSKPLPEKPAGYVDPNSPAELVMTFPDPRFIPSEVSLNRTFKCFGPLNVLQTELDRDGNRARVVFKRSCDAEIACSSASKFKIFGSLVVNYQLNYTLSDPFTTYYKPIPLPEASATI